MCGAADICAQILEVYRERDVLPLAARAPAEQEPPPPGTGWSPGSASPGPGSGRPHAPGTGAQHANGHPHGGSGGVGGSLSGGGTGFAPSGGGGGSSLGSFGVSGATAGGGGDRAQAFSAEQAPWPREDSHAGAVQGARQAAPPLSPAFAASPCTQGLAVRRVEDVEPRACRHAVGDAEVASGRSWEADWALRAPVRQGVLGRALPEVCAAVGASV